MKKTLITLVCFVAFALCNAQNIIVLDKEDANEYVILSPTGKVIKTLTGIKVNGNAENMICAKDLKSQKLGYISLVTGNWVIAPQFENISDTRNFSEGLVVIKKEYENGVAKSAVVDIKGNIILPFCDWDISNYSNGMAIVEKPGYLFGAIDKTGKLVVPFSVGKLNDFINGLAIKGSNKEYVDDYAEETGLWGFMDKTGKMVIKQEWSWASPFSEGLAAVKNKQKKWGCIDKTGKLVIPCTFESSFSFTEGLAPVEISTGKGDETLMTFIDKTGKQVTNQKFEVARNFVDGMAAVAKITPSENEGEEGDYKFGFIDKNFKLVIPIVHQKAVQIGYYLQYFSFTEGLCPTSKGYIDKTGKLVLSLQNLGDVDYEPFSHGTALITVYFKEGTKDYLIAKTGKILWKSGYRLLKAG